MKESASTLVIILGASAFLQSPRLTGSDAFRMSAEDMIAYFLNPRFFNLPRANLLNLFDAEGSPADIHKRMSRFLRERQVQSPVVGQPIKNLILYYVGHGGFTAVEQAYFLALRATEENFEGVSSLRMTDLARTLSLEARGLRRFLILDCCFAETAYNLFQSAGEGPADAAHEKALLDFPHRGTALLCSSSARDVSITPSGGKYTMFSGALLEVLRAGDPDASMNLSLEQVSRRVSLKIFETYADEGVRPKVSSPDQSEGDIADIPLFPNFPPEKPKLILSAPNPILPNAAQLPGHSTDVPQPTWTSSLEFFFKTAPWKIRLPLFVVLLSGLTLGLWKARTVLKESEIPDKTDTRVPKRGSSPDPSTPPATCSVPVSIDPSAVTSVERLNQLFPASHELNTLVEPFRSDVRRFLCALYSAGATVTVQDTTRPPERSYIQHYAFRIAREGYDPTKVPALPCLDFAWARNDKNGNYSVEESRKVANSIVDRLGLALRPALVTRHSEGKAIDLEIGWTGSLRISRADGKLVVIDGLPRSSMNQQLWDVGLSYNLKKLTSDPPHWSTDGH